MYTNCAYEYRYKYTHTNNPASVYIDISIFTFTTSISVYVDHMNWGGDVGIFRNEHADINIPVSTYTRDDFYIHIYNIYICISVHSSCLIYIYTYTHTYTSLIPSCTHLYLHIYSCIVSYIYIYIRTYIHTSHLISTSNFASQCNTLQHTATHCNTLQHTHFIPSCTANCIWSVIESQSPISISNLNLLGLILTERGKSVLEN